MTGKIAVNEMNIRAEKVKPCTDNSLCKYDTCSRTHELKFWHSLKVFKVRRHTYLKFFRRMLSPYDMYKPRTNIISFPLNHGAAYSSLCMPFFIFIHLQALICSDTYFLPIFINDFIPFRRIARTLYLPLMIWWRLPRRMPRRHSLLWKFHSLMIDKNVSYMSTWVWRGSRASTDGKKI